MNASNGNGGFNQKHIRSERKRFQYKYLIHEAKHNIWFEIDTMIHAKTPLHNGIKSWDAFNVFESKLQTMK